jgi:hypothetical protein
MCTKVTIILSKLLTLTKIYQNQNSDIEFTLNTDVEKMQILMILSTGVERNLEMQLLIPDVEEQF